jgi:hypothetical protein
MEKQVLKKEEKTVVNGFIISVQLSGAVPPKQSFVRNPDDLAAVVASVLDSTPHAVVLVQASVNL